MMASNYRLTLMRRKCQLCRISTSSTTTTTVPMWVKVKFHQSSPTRNPSPQLCLKTQRGSTLSQIHPAMLSHSPIKMEQVMTTSLYSTHRRIPSHSPQMPCKVKACTIKLTLWPTETSHSLICATLMPKRIKRLLVRSSSTSILFRMLQSSHSP